MSTKKYVVEVAETTTFYVVVESDANEMELSSDLAYKAISLLNASGGDHRNIDVQHTHYTYVGFDEVDD